MDHAVGINEILGRFFGTLGVGHAFAALAVVILTIIILVFRRVDVAVLMMLVLSISTGIDEAAVSHAAYLGRWYFLVLAAVLGLARLAKTSGAITGLALVWACANVMGIVYSASLEEGAVRGLFFLLAVPAFMWSLGPPYGDSHSLIRLIRWFALSGLVLAGIHVIFMISSPPGRGVERFSSAFENSQSLSISTATVTLPMIWALLTKNAGKWTALLFIGVLVNLTAMLASTQRTGLVSLGTAILILLLFYRSRGLVTAVLTGSAVVFLLWPVVTYLTSPATLAYRFSTAGARDRTRIWSHFFREAMESPIWGHGSGSASMAGVQAVGLSFHNSYLVVLYDLGILGLACFCAMILAGMLSGMRLSIGRRGARRALGVFVLAGLFQVVIQGITEVGLANTANHTAMLFYFTLGVAAACSKMAFEGDPRAETYDDRAGSFLPHTHARLASVR
jgi:O-antigen ligase